MSVQNDTFLRVTPKSVKIPYEGEEEKRFESFLKKRGLKKGPFLRVLINRTVESAESIESGKTQIDITAFQNSVTQEELETQS
jgi:hypothetical protein